MNNNPEEEKSNKTLMDDLKTVEDMLSWLKLKAKLTETHVDYMRKILILLALEKAIKQVPPPPSAANPKSKSKQASKKQRQSEPLYIDVETNEALKKYISPMLDMVNLVQEKAAATWNRTSGQVRAGNISEQAELRNHIGNPWE